MQLNDLERALARIPPHPRPRADLEQYATPADLAAPLLFEAYALGDLAGKGVADLGCGTGVLAIGAALLGARPVVGIDVDDAALEVARREAERARVDAEFLQTDVREWDRPAHTALMNPPFGAQAKGADRPFLDAAFRTAAVVYSLHHAPTRAFVEAAATARGFSTTHRWRLRFPLRHQYRHHEKAVQEIDVIAYRFERASLSQGRQAAAGVEGVAGAWGDVIG